MRKPITFIGWKVQGETIAPDAIEAGRKFRGHEGAEVKRILKVKKLTPAYSR